MKIKKKIRIYFKKIKNFFGIEKDGVSIRFRFFSLRKRDSWGYKEASPRFGSKESTLVCPRSFFSKILDFQIRLLYGIPKFLKIFFFFFLIKYLQNHYFVYFRKKKHDYKHFQLFYIDY